MYGADFAAWMLVIMINGKSGKVYNVGSDKGITLSDLAEKVSRFSASSPKILLNTSLTGSVVNTTLVPDTTEVLKEFELTQLTDVDTAIDRTIKWYELDFGKKQIG